MAEVSRSITPAAWPAVSTLVRTDGYTEAPERNVATFQPEGAGSPIEDMLSNIETDDVNYSIVIDIDEYYTFIDWYDDTVKSGTLPFTFPNPRTGVTNTYTFVGDPSVRMLTHDHLVLTLPLRKMP